MTVLAAFRTYVTDHSREWELYTNSSKYVCNCQVNISVGVAPFKIVISEVLIHLEIKLIPSREEPQRDLRRKWNHCLLDTMKKANERLDKAQPRYKKNYDERMRKKS